MATLRIPRGSSPALQLTIREPAEAPAVGDPMDLTGVPVTIFEHNLPIVPTITVTDAPAGKALLSFPDTSPMPVNRSHQMRIRVGAPGDPGTFTTPFIEVMTQ